MQRWSKPVAAWILVLVALIGVGPARAKRDAPPRAPLKLTLIEPLEFGKLVRDGAGRGIAVIVPGTTARTLSGLASLGGSYGPAVYEIQGAPGAQISIDLPYELHLGPGVKLRKFRSLPDLVGTLGPDGRLRLEVGATLVLRARAHAGDFKSAFRVTVSYQ